MIQNNIDKTTMNNRFVRLAFGQPLKQSSCRLLLVAMAAHAEPTGVVSPLHIQDLMKLTCQDRKTVVRGLKKLQDENYIVDTGSRFGDTNQGKIYRLHFEDSAEEKPPAPGPLQVFPITPAETNKVTITISVDGGQVSVG